MPKFKALRTFHSESKGPIEEGQVLEITVGQADAINKFTQEHYGEDFFERVEDPKKAGKK